MSQFFMYKPLDPLNSEIRLLEFNSNGSYNLITASLHSALPYSALSYVWGDASITESIVLDGVSFPVTTNLAAALQHARSHWVAHYPTRNPTDFKLWVDAICINQKDIPERNKQVQRMADIYSSADLVIAWLGQSTPEIILAFELFEIIWKETCDLSDDSFASLEWLKKFPRLWEDDLHESARTPFKNSQWNAANDLFAIPYWGRVWIVQEMAVARSVLLCAGGLSLMYDKIQFAWSQLELFRTHVMRHRNIQRPDFLRESVWELLSTDFDSWRTVKRITAGRTRAELAARDQQQANDISSGSMFSIIGRSYMATDPKDHIYGLLALTRIDVIPDYSPQKTVGEVYRDYVAALLKHCSSDAADATTKPLFFLYYAGIGIFENTLALPSWAPNFPEESKKGLTGFHIESATADTGVFRAQLLTPDIRNSYLVVDGIKVDTITIVEHAPHEDTWFDGSMLTYIQDFIRRNSIYTTGIPPLQAILRAIRLDPTDLVNDESFYYAYALLEFILSVDIPNRDANLKALGLGIGSDFNSGFPESFAPGASAPGKDWWGSMWGDADTARDEFHSELRFTVISNLTWLRKRWRFCETNGGYFGLAPLYARTGDLVCILNGCDTPVVLRQERGQVFFVGSAFVVGLMKGEAREVVEDRGLQVQRFEIS
ncbi:HET-domain-containing protein [Tothia fuscella]|uniref:HET-domain-containing protein n=1 Tax=Tothia fuscella TaxID=1048955 RepID=A0A9P4P476_9PEZI|nr:HET-domain-containing protein [Tothia fuscella]